MVPPAPTGDFQDLPIWRRLTVRTLQEIYREYDRLLLVPMTLVEPQHLDEIFGSCAWLARKSGTFFLFLEEALLRIRVENQIMTPDDPERDAGVRQWQLNQGGRCLAAKGEMPPDTVFLNSGCTAMCPCGPMLAALLVLRTPTSS